MTAANGDDGRHLDGDALGAPGRRRTERDIQFSLRLDRLAASIEAAETALRELRAEYDDLLAAQEEALDTGGSPRVHGEWLGHALVERAIELLRAPQPDPKP